MRRRARVIATPRRQPLREPASAPADRFSVVALPKTNLVGFSLMAPRNVPGVVLGWIWTF